ncbi:MAG: M13 family metallopeptidase, partial [Thermoanaerobaculia bacterium]
MRRLIPIIAAVILAGCASQPQRPAARAAAAPSTGFDLSNVDRTANACTDFYQFANGGWMKSNPIPAGYSNWGNFTVLASSNQEKARAILSEAAKANAPAGSDPQRVGDYYASCMDEKSIERAGLAPIQPDLARIAALRSVSDLPQTLAHFHSYRIPSVFAFGSTQDFKNTEQVVAAINQSGLGLPDRDYYTKEDPKSKEIRVRYLQHVARMLELLGSDKPDAQGQARNIMDFETRLAQASMTNVELRDPQATYHKVTRDELQALAPSFSWPEYFSAVGLPSVQTIIVGQPQFLTEVGQLIRTTPLDTWKSYLRWNLINSEASKLPKQFEDTDFDFYQRYLSGTKENRPRWKRCVAATDTVLGEALGRLWTQRYFPDSAKTQALDMVNNLTRALRENLSTLPWMSPETRQQALAKLQAFGLKIGYPEKWRDYSGLNIVRGDALGNAERATQFEEARDLGKVGKPVDP